MAELAVAESFGVTLFEVGLIFFISLIVAYVFKNNGIHAAAGILLGVIFIGFNEEF